MSLAESSITRFLAEHTLNRQFGEEEFSRLGAFVKLSLIDTTGVAVAARDEPLVQSLLNSHSANARNEGAALFGGGPKFDVMTAALINGSMAHALDYDDTLPWFQGHPSVVLWGAILPLAQNLGCTGKQAMEAYLVGLEVGCLLSQYMGNEHYAAGWHGTATIGRNAATAACCRLLGLTSEQTVNALGISGTNSAGFKTSFGTMCKPFHSGSAARGGVEAALMAQAGFTGSSEVFESKLGMKGLMAGVGSNSVGLAYLSHHPVEKLVFKYHAACHCTHAPIDIIMASSGTHGFRADDITDIKVHCSQISMDAAGNPDPKTGLDAKFSIAYAMSSALVKNDTGIANFTDDQVDDPDVRALMSRVSVDVDETLEGLRTTCAITLRSGETYTDTQDPNERTVPIDEQTAKLVGKFTSALKSLMTADQMQALREAIEGFDCLDNVNGFMAATELQ